MHFGVKVRFLQEPFENNTLHNFKSSPFFYIMVRVSEAFMFIMFSKFIMLSFIHVFKRSGKGTSYYFSVFRGNILEIMKRVLVRTFK